MLHLTIFMIKIFKFYIFLYYVTSVYKNNLYFILFFKFILQTKYKYNIAYLTGYTTLKYYIYCI